MDFGYDARTLDLRKQLLTFMEERVCPAEAVFAEQVGAAVQGGHQWERVPVTADLKAEARGVSQDFPLAHLWASARTLRFADGPDEVHKRSLARRELRRAMS